MKEGKNASWTPTNPVFDPTEPMQVGGQAVIEGVMMRAKGTIATAVRRASGAILVRREKYRTLVERYPALKIPVIRGALGLIEMLYVGIRTLNFSAEVAMEDEAVPASGSRKPPTRLSLLVTLMVALALGLGLFFVLPLYTATAILSVEQNPVLFNLVAGAIRALILVSYLYGISFMKEVGILFRYHGAEHKAVFAFEHNAQLDVPTAMRFSRFHPRCGTSFVLIVAVASVVMFSFLDAGMLLLVDSLTLPLRVATHLPFVAVVAGVSYEFLKLSARHAATRLGTMVVAPGLWLQRITTQEPDERQMHVALAALKAALHADGIADNECTISTEEEHPAVAAG